MSNSLVPSFVVRWLIFIQTTARHALHNSLFNAIWRKNMKVLGEISYSFLKKAEFSLTEHE